MPMLEYKCGVCDFISHDEMMAKRHQVRIHTDHFIRDFDRMASELDHLKRLVKIYEDTSEKMMQILDDERRML